jgi:CMP-N-acetylneuraminic acid synthetase
VSVLAIVPARSGSKSVPDKNVASFRGKPLLVHSVVHALAAQNVDRVLVSTDSQRYRELALAAGAEAPFLRPASLAGDLSTDLEVFTHALTWLEHHEGYRPDICVHLRPTSPTRRIQDVEAAVAMMLADPEADSVRSVTLATQTPYKMWRLGADGTLRPLLPSGALEAYNLPRQVLPPVYVQNAAVDVVRSSVILQHASMTGTRVLAYVMDTFADVDDWRELAELERQFPEGELPTGLTFGFDLDGVLASLVPDGEYGQAEPLAAGVALARRLHEAGNRIVVFTARGSATGRDWTELTRTQLHRWGVPFHALHFGKPAADYYVDDRMISLATLEAWIESGGQRRRKSA